jgi:hypothetical protein
MPNVGRNGLVIGELDSLSGSNLEIIDNQNGPILPATMSVVHDSIPTRVLPLANRKTRHRLRLSQVQYPPRKHEKSRGLRPLEAVRLSPHRQILWSVVRLRMLTHWRRCDRSHYRVRQSQPVVHVTGTNSPSAADTFSNSTTGPRCAISTQT